MDPSASVTSEIPMTDLDIELLIRGRQPSEATIEYARSKIRAAARAGPGSIRFARIKLSVDPHRRIERPARAEAMLDVDGHTVLAQATARSLRGAIDLLEERLRRRLADAHGRPAALRRRSHKETG
jgi:ribosome-associated translation inhibitor RaiA